MSKLEEDSGEGEEEMVITVTEIEIEPNMCPIGEPLALHFDFIASKPLKDAQWQVSYTVDSVRKRHIIQLGESKVADIEEGKNEFDFEVDSINVSGIKPSRLTNVGLLSATLHSHASSKEPQHVIDVNMVVQVSVDGDTYSRCIYNPLE